MIIHNIEQRTQEWYQLRAGMPTASTFSKLVTSNGEPSKSTDELAIQLGSEAFTGTAELDTWDGNRWTERGKEMEDQAVAFYEFHTDLETSPVGFVTDDDKQYGCSPDAFVGDDGVLEIKCLKATTHGKTLQYKEKHGKAPTTYHLQTQGQMMICERKWCDLLFFHPLLPSFIIRQEPDENIYTALKKQLKEVNRLRDEMMKLYEKESK